MGFKKTSEGRVYFQGVENDAPPKPKSRLQDQKKPEVSNQSAPHTQMQIVTLLKTLNERLKVTQAERNKMAKELEAYRGLIEDLQNKTERSERAYMSLEQKLSKNAPESGGHAEILARDALKELEETRALLSELDKKATRADRNSAALKKMQVDQAEKMALSINHTAALTKRLKDTEERQEQIGVRIDDAISQQGRLTRKIDKAIEERMRFMRKLERIEETVLQTRDSLNAKAMVLLTEQGVTAQDNVSLDQPEILTDEAPPKTFADDNEDNRTLHAIGIGLLVLAGLLGGWLMSELNKPEAEPQVTTTQIQTQQTANAGPSEIDMTAMEWSVQQDTSAFNEAGAAASGFETQLTATQNDDIGTLDLNNQAQVEALLDENPDAVAAALNNIEPSNPLPENIIAPDPIPEQASLSPQDQKAEPTPPETKQAPAKPDVKAAAPTAKDPKTLIKPDGSLPDVVKPIEAQAFEGVAEAQHDLAAIYTAGHGGAKQDYKRAALWFEQAAAGGIGNAAYNLGVLHHQGLGVKADLEKAIAWYKNAAAQGHPEAQYNLGIAYIEGIGVPYDAQKAAGYFTNAAENNIMEAAYNLGLIYENGLLGDAEPDKALVWYKTAADQGSPEARQALEQLAKSLNISVDDVNGLAESMKGANAPTPENVAVAESVASIAPAAAPSRVTGEQIVIAQIQEYLMRLGLYPGPADGITGPLTQDAIRSYQRQHNLEPNGNASDLLLSHMLANVIVDDVTEQGSRAQ